MSLCTHLAHSPRIRIVPSSIQKFPRLVREKDPGSVRLSVHPCTRPVAAASPVSLSLVPLHPPEYPETFLLYTCQLLTVLVLAVCIVLAVIVRTTYHTYGVPRTYVPSVCVVFGTRLHRYCVLFCVYRNPPFHIESHPPASPMRRASTRKVCLQKCPKARARYTRRTLPTDTGGWRHTHADITHTHAARMQRIFSQTNFTIHRPPAASPAYDTYFKCAHGICSQM